MFCFRLANRLGVIVVAGVGVGVVGAAYIRTEYLDIDCCPLCHRANPDLWPGIVPQENLIEYKFVLGLILSSPRSSFFISHHPD